MITIDAFAIENGGKYHELAGALVQIHVSISKGRYSLSRTGDLLFNIV